MPCLPHDPSIYVEISTIEELVEDFSWRLRKRPRLQPLLTRVIGNHWQEFEQGLIQFYLSILFLEGGHELIVKRALENADQLSLALLADISNEMLESCFAILPFHAAASLNEVTERIIDTVLVGFGPDWDAAHAEEQKIRVTRVGDIIKANAIFR